MNWNDILLRLRALAFRRKVERELDDELRSPIEMQVERISAGE